MSAGRLLSFRTSEIAVTPDKRPYLPAAVFMSCILLLIFGFAHLPFVESFVDSDKLLPADWTRHIFHDGYPILGFQLPRTPSIFPDFLVFVPLQIVTGSWRVAIFVLAAGLLVAVVGAAGIIAGRITGIPASRAIASFWILLFPLLLVELAHSGWGRHFMIVTAVSHGGVFVVSLWTAILSDHLRRSRNKILALLLGAICALAVLSDKLFVFTFVVPFSVALFLIPTEGSVRRSLLLVVALGSVAGWFGAGLINHEPDIALEWSLIPHRLAMFVHDINASIFVGTFVPVLLLIGAPVAARRLPKAMLATDAARFYWIFAVTAIAGTVGLTAAFLYEDVARYRYLASAIWWPTIFAAATLALLLERRPRLMQGLSAAMLAMSVAMALYSGVSPDGSLWTWQHPTARCLAGQDIDPALGDGLAEYWQARPIEISSGWRLQVDPLHADGEISYWGNDLASYSNSHFDRSRPPDYRFIVMDSLDPKAIADKIRQAFPDVGLRKYRRVDL